MHNSYKIREERLHSFPSNANNNTNTSLNISYGNIASDSQKKNNLNFNKPISKSTLELDTLQSNHTKNTKYTQKTSNSSDYGDSIGVKCTSPTNWICDVGKEVMQDVFYSKSPNKSIQEAKKNDLWRQKTTKTILSDDSDDENHRDNTVKIETTINNIAVRKVNSTERNSLGRFTPNNKEYNKLQDDLSIALSVNSFLTSNSATSSFSQRNSVINSNGEARIVAPNVSKLSPNSAVEVKLKSPNETVAVLCSVDVLKMRSGFFHDILSEQEKNRQLKSGSTNAIIWREAIVVLEQMPFEAAGS